MNVNELYTYTQYGIPEDILQRKLHGDFAGAIALIERRLLDDNLAETLRGSLMAQKRICQMLPAEFPYSRSDALAIVREYIPSFTERELDTLIEKRRIRWIYVNGEIRIFDRFFSSLCKAIPEFGQRANVPLPGVESAQNGSPALVTLEQAHAQMRRDGSMTTHIRIRATVKLKDEHFHSGMFLRAHLPIPKGCPQQQDIKIEYLFPENGQIAPENALQRTICWEGTFQENTEFVVEYSYRHTARYQDAYHGSGLPGVYDFDIQEQAPHILFTPYIRQLCAELTSGMTDPLEKARAFYDFITRNMHYTYMPSYVVLENIAENCARNYTGDCGVFALLFVTLCRCAGIPAQWQSGLTAEPDFIGGHDWVRFYVEPYGWLFADPSYGVAAVRCGSEDRRQFYFGNLDPYRMVANSAFYAPFTIPKQHWRADPYDNQLGEIETTDRGFDYGDYERSKVLLTCR